MVMVKSNERGSVAIKKRCCGQFVPVWKILNPPILWFHRVEMPKVSTIMNLPPIQRTPSALFYIQTNIFYMYSNGGLAGKGVLVFNYVKSWLI